MSEELLKKIYAEPRRVAFLEGADDKARMVSANYPLPTFDNCAALTSGDTDGWSVVHKFGHNEAVGTSYVPICYGGLYPTPQVSGATALRIKAGGDANDTAAGTGAREVTFYGIDETGAEISEAVATNGASASLSTTTTFMRLFRAIVTASGTYATAAAGSHAASITIENAAGTADWAVIALEGFPRAQSYIGAYTVPLGKEAYVVYAHATTDSTKVTDMVFFAREGVLDTAPPYKAMRAQRDVHVGPRGFADITTKAPLGPFPALTDFGFMGKVDAGTAEVDVNFEIWLRDVA